MAAVGHAEHLCRPRRHQLQRGHQRLSLARPPPRGVIWRRRGTAAAAAAVAAAAAAAAGTVFVVQRYVKHEFSSRV